MVKESLALLSQTRKLYEAMYRFDARAAAELGLHVTDLRCVNALEAGPLSAGEIGERLVLTSGSVTALVDRLISRGYAARTADPRDARRTRVALTPEFYLRAERVYARLGMTIEQAFRDTRPATREQAVPVLECLAFGFEAAAGRSNE
jgi:DNA-binding MarR family transcriptional regulator